MTTISITHIPSGVLLAEGPSGWGITPFEGNFHIRRKYLKLGQFRANGFPGLCLYKFLYVWLDLWPGNGTRIKSLGWMYWVPNPLFPFIAFRVALPGRAMICIRSVTGARATAGLGGPGHFGPSSLNPRSMLAFHGV